jgi:hypothetical protein
MEVGGQLHHNPGGLALLRQETGQEIDGKSLGVGIYHPLLLGHATAFPDNVFTVYGHVC